jgi:MFS family permease
MPVAYGTPRARGILLTTILGSGVAFLDATIVNVALPAIGRALDTGLSGLQWTVDAYLLTLTAFLLPGGDAGDRLGHRRVFVSGLAGFGVASALCGLAPGTGTLVAARALQGCFAALLVPGSLAILRSCFREEDQGKAIGAWAALSGISTAIGPLAGGWLVDLHWRAIFFVNVPLVAVAIWAALRFVPAAEPVPAADRRRADVAGAVLVAAGLALVTFALIEATGHGASGRVLVTGALGAAALVAFVAVERRRGSSVRLRPGSGQTSSGSGGTDSSPAPMLPLGVFRSRAFSGLNLLTLGVYFGLNGAIFLLTLQLQTGLGWSPLEAGASLLPLTALIFLLSPLAGRLVPRLGARPLLAAGPLLAGAGLALLGGVGPGDRWLSDVLPGVLVLGVGMGLTVAPLTAAVLAALPAAQAGIASAVNNATARLAGLLAVAALPLLGGLSAGALGGDGGGLGPGFRQAMLVSAALTAAGGLAGWRYAPAAVPLSPRAPRRRGRNAARGERAG